MVLVSSAKFRTEDGICQYRDISLPSLKHETVLQLYNTCIEDLIRFSHDPSAANDENLLAALVMLRYHEEMDTYYTGEDKERLLHSTRFLLNAQSESSIETMCGDTYKTSSVPSTKISPDITGVYFKSFRHNIFRIALRQELTAAYLTQRPVQYPLTLWYLLDDIEASCEDDFIWADRHLLHCARVLDFCYRSRIADESSDVKIWQELNNYDTQWEKNMPASFLPLLEEQPDGEQGQILYRTWYMSLTHLSAVQFFELSRILIMVFDPTLPRHGVNALTAHQALSKGVRGIVIHLCSIAASYPDFTPAFVQAAMAVAICGEYFVIREEQDTLLSFLSHLECVFGWPTSRHVARLNQAWKNDR